MTKTEILKKHLTGAEKATWNAVLEEAKFITKLLESVNQIVSPVIRNHLYNEITPELNRLKDEKRKLEITAQVRYEESLKRNKNKDNDENPFGSRPFL